MSASYKRGAAHVATATVGNWVTPGNVRDGYPASSGPPESAKVATAYANGVAGSSATMTVTGYNFSTVGLPAPHWEVPADATVNYVRVEPTYNFQNYTMWASATLEVLDGSTPIGAAINLPIEETAGLIRRSFVCPVSLAQLRSGSLATRVTVTLTGSASGSKSFSLDMVDILVDWSPKVVVPPPSVGWPKVWTGAGWVKKPAKVWNGSAWVQKPVKVWTGSAWKTLT